MVINPPLILLTVNLNTWALTKLIIQVAFLLQTHKYWDTILAMQLHYTVLLTSNQSLHQSVVSVMTSPGYSLTLPLIGLFKAVPNIMKMLHCLYQESAWQVLIRSDTRK